MTSKYPECTALFSTLHGFYHDFVAPGMITEPTSGQSSRYAHAQWSRIGTDAKICTIRCSFHILHYGNGVECRMRAGKFSDVVDADVSGELFIIQ